MDSTPRSIASEKGRTVVILSSYDLCSSAVWTLVFLVILAVVVVVVVVPRCCCCCSEEEEQKLWKVVPPPEFESWWRRLVCLLLLDPWKEYGMEGVWYGMEWNIK